MADFNHDDPHSEGEEGESQDDWDKVASNTVCYPLDGSLEGGREERRVEKERGEGKGRRGDEGMEEKGEKGGERIVILLVAHTHTYTLAMHTKRYHYACSACENTPYYNCYSPTQEK